MNKHKRGRPYIYTHTTILYLLLLTILFRISLREVIAYVLYHKLLNKIPNFRTLSYRIGSLPIEKYQQEILSYVENKSNNNRFMAISIDATGSPKTKLMYGLKKGIKLKIKGHGWS